MDGNNLLATGGAIAALVSALVWMMKTNREDMKELIGKFESDAQKSRDFLSLEMDKRDVVLGKMADAVDKLSERVDRLDATVSGCPARHNS